MLVWQKKYTCVEFSKVLSLNVAVMHRLNADWYSNVTVLQQLLQCSVHHVKSYGAGDQLIYQPKATSDTVSSTNTSFSPHPPTHTCVHPPTSLCFIGPPAFSKMPGCAATTVLLLVVGIKVGPLYKPGEGFRNG